LGDTSKSSPRLSESDGQKLESYASVESIPAAAEESSEESGEMRPRRDSKTVGRFGGGFKKTIDTLRNKGKRGEPSISEKGEPMSPMGKATKFRVGNPFGKKQQTEAPEGATIKRRLFFLSTLGFSCWLLIT